MTISSARKQSILRCCTNGRPEIHETQAREKMLSQCFRHSEAEIKASVGCLLVQPTVTNIAPCGLPTRVTCPLAVLPLLSGSFVSRAPRARPLLFSMNIRGEYLTSLCHYI